MENHREELKPEPRWKVADILLYVVAVPLILGLFVLMLIPVHSLKWGPDAYRSAQAANDVQQIVTAVGSYYNEYGTYPGNTENPDHQALFSVLRGGPGGETINNPREILFIEGREATEHRGKLRRGFGPDNTFYDPWGNPYEVRVDHDYTNTVRGPGDNGEEIQRGVIAWTTSPKGELIASWK